MEAFRTPPTETHTAMTLKEVYSDGFEITVRSFRARCRSRERGPLGKRSTVHWLRLHFSEN